MIALIFILLLLIGFLLFNPLKNNVNAETGQKSSSIFAFGIYCFICVGVFYYLTINDNTDLINKLANGKPNPYDNAPEKILMDSRQEEQPTQEEQELPQKNSINFDVIPNVSRHFIPIRELSEFDGKSKAELYKIRKAIVDASGGLGGKNYYPSEEIFGGIKDIKPWWGTEGILCKGQGNHASDGMSRESSYFNNPFILLNLGLGRVMNGNNGKEDCSGLWPQPTELVVYPQEKTIRVEYDLSGFMKEFEGSAFYNSVNKADWFEFANINARDFGYTYAQAYETNGIRFANTPNASTGARLNNYWCLGHSCQIEGGCNNICPSNDPFTFFVNFYPAYAKFRLYKKEPSAKTEPDAYFEIYLN